MCINFHLHKLLEVVQSAFQNIFALMNHFEIPLECDATKIHGFPPVKFGKNEQNCGNEKERELVRENLK